ncbi:hypothetical protein [Bordetella genomosp. 13]|uniref:hypothetical protein n=1 Tax=Bordetella genomosp. 13 TaxID=463040 RepID=UPI0018DF3CFF|nr:hypothetical protein [Bordetella genomosp. 13]
MRDPVWVLLDGGSDASGCPRAYGWFPDNSAGRDMDWQFANFELVYKPLKCGRIALVRLKAR